MRDAAHNVGKLIKHCACKRANQVPVPDHDGFLMCHMGA